MLISAWSRSTRSRRSSVEHANFFFEPVQFDFQPANLFVECVVAGLDRRAFPGPPIHKKLGDLLHRGLPPLRDLNGMHFELRAQLAQRLFTPDRFNRHPRLESRTVLFPRRHQPLLVRLTTRRNLNLLRGLNYWDHYSLRCPPPVSNVSRATIVPCREVSVPALVVAAV